LDDVLRFDHKGFRRHFLGANQALFRLIERAFHWCLLEVILAFAQVTDRRMPPQQVVLEQRGRRLGHADVDAAKARLRGTWVVAGSNWRGRCIGWLLHGILSSIGLFTWLLSNSVNSLRLRHRHESFALYGWENELRVTER
jgi:hypothetical protein